MDRIYAVIMAGGSGERFWPLSTPARPKQFLRLIGEKSLLRMTVERITPLVPIDRQVVIAGRQHAVRVEEELPELPPGNVILEPVGRNTAACIGLASLFIERRNPEAITVTLPADHHIPETAAFLEAVEKAVYVARDAEVAVTIGVKPDRPEIGFGYMQIGSVAAPDVYHVLRFHEKPDAEVAQQYCSGEDYFWNTGIFVWRNRIVQRLIEKHLSDHWSKLEHIRRAMGTAGYEQILAEIYPSVEKISIDHGVLEKAPDIQMVRGRFGWDDLGSWTSLGRILSRNRDGNVVSGRHVGLGTSECIIYAKEGKVIATVGLRDLIIADTTHGLLICPKSRAQDLKELLRLIGRDSDPHAKHAISDAAPDTLPFEEQ
jgi:mannose-1-phosphate guanylyltransferase